MLPPSVIDMQASTPRDVMMSSRSLLTSETICGAAELRPTFEGTTCHILKCHEEFDETIRTVSEPESSRRRIEHLANSGTGSTRSAPDGRPRPGFSKSSASLQSLVRRRSRRHGGASSLPSEIELSSRQAVHPVDFVKDVGGVLPVFRNEEETQTATPTSTLIYATTNTAQPSTSRLIDNPTAQDVSSSASNVAATTTGGNVTSTTNAGRLGNTAVALLRSISVAKPGPSTSSSWNSSTEQESDYVVDPVQGNAYYKGQFLGKVSTLNQFLFLHFFKLYFLFANSNYREILETSILFIYFAEKYVCQYSGLKLYLPFATN